MPTSTRDPFSYFFQLIRIDITPAITKGKVEMIILGFILINPIKSNNNIMVLKQAKPISENALFGFC